MEGKNSFQNSLELIGFLKKRGLLDSRNKAICLDIATGNGNLFDDYMPVLMPQIIARQLRGSPFNVPDESVEGKVKFALTEAGMPIGINPEECHVLIAGQTNTGKSTLLKIIFAQALLFNEKQEERQDNGKDNLLALR